MDISDQSGLVKLAVIFGENSKCMSMVGVSWWSSVKQRHLVGDSQGRHAGDGFGRCGNWS